MDLDWLRGRIHRLHPGVHSRKGVEKPILASYHGLAIHLDFERHGRDQAYYSRDPEEQEDEEEQYWYERWVLWENMGELHSFQQERTRLRRLAIQDPNACS
jgi:hypothetical protein